MAIYADLQSLEPGELVDLFDVDTTTIGGDLRYMHGYTQVGPIHWQGRRYDPFPIDAHGFAISGDGQPPSPTIVIANVDGIIGALCRALDDLIDARITRRRTLGKYLDAANFPGGNPTADPVQELPPEVWFVEQRSSETAEAVELKLSSPIDLGGRQLPGRQVIANVCSWLSIGGYRSSWCGYTGSRYFTERDEPTTDPALDRCAGRVQSCRLRFGEGVPLNYGSFPSADAVRR